ncbi:unnamed protein product [Cuscuta campestris]|uniref:Uncharacterized protein n=1 Tax=Cuscuta campestris TaxID=132261 RepID=A0A484KUG4_9ASTE|nr:unnamed protein product [Cuscuta campestris]
MSLQVSKSVECQTWHATCQTLTYLYVFETCSRTLSSIATSRPSQTTSLHCSQPLLSVTILGVSILQLQLV